MYKQIIRPLLFKVDPEKVHHLIVASLKCARYLGINRLYRPFFQSNHPSLEREVFGLRFKNPVGLAAGFDKNAELYKELSDFGFGFIEIGTLTPKGQPGNPKKRIFRLKKDQALVNRMGFNNQGVDAAVKRLKSNKNVLIGGNIGKNKVTPNDEALNDYLYCFNALFDFVDYFVVNVSSPNTPGLRALQEKKPLTEILSALKIQNTKMAQDKKEKEKPILLKIAPDLTDEQLLDIVSIVEETRIDGVIATNTTLDRSHLKSDPELVNQAGGLSGKPLTKRSTEVIRFLHEKSKGSFPIIGVGGIHDEADALEKIQAGASLVQLWTGFIYQGPSLVKRINQAILKNQ